jgi:hypothetical protein
MSLATYQPAQTVITTSRSEGVTTSGTVDIIVPAGVLVARDSSSESSTYFSSAAQYVATFTTPVSLGVINVIYGPAVMEVPKYTSSNAYQFNAFQSQQ